MVKTAALVVVAIILGVIMLNIIDDGSTSKALTHTPRTTTTIPATTTTAASPRTTTTTAKAGPVITPRQLRVLVLNAGSGVNGAASTMSQALKNKGYVNQGPPSDTKARTGTAVACRNGLTREAQALKVVVDQGSTVIPFPSPTPTGVDSTVQCLVLIGKPTK